MKCARCGAETIQRKNRVTGVDFTGCSAWPKCTWSHNPPRRELVGSVEALRIAGGDEDEMGPDWSEDYGIFHDY